MSKKFWKFSNPLFNSLPKINRVLTRDLFEKFKTDKSVKDDLILSLLPICKLILEQRMYKNPGLQRIIDDLAGVLILKTCTWVDELTNHDHFTSRYYWQVIKNSINSFNSGDANPNVTGNWLRIQHGEGFKAPVRISLREDLLQINPTHTFEFADILLAMAETHTEREFIILRFQGFNDSEIAEKLSTSESTISRLRLDLEDRYDYYSKKTREELL